MFNRRALVLERRGVTAEILRKPRGLRNEQAQAQYRSAASSAVLRSYRVPPAGFEPDETPLAVTGSMLGFMGIEQPI